MLDPYAVSRGLPAGLGPIEQICFITTDIPSSADFWARNFGAGPFFHMEHVDLLDVKYRGKPTIIDQSIALGYWQGLQIEFIHQHNDSETIFTDWTNGTRSGLHHVLVNSPDVEATRRDLAKLGCAAAQEARIGLGGEYIFFDMNSADVPYLEVVRLAPLFKPLFTYMQRASVGWDGNNALRQVPDQSEWR